MSDAKAGFLSKIHYIVLTAVLGVALLFTIIGTATPQFLLEKAQTISSGFGVTTVTAKNTISLWKYEQCQNGACKSGDVDDEGFMPDGCTGRTEFKGARAFCILSILIGAAALVVVVLETLSPGPLGEIFQKFSGLASVVAAGVYAFFLFIAFIIVGGMYDKKLCPGQKTLKEQDYKYGAGFGLLLVAWLLTIIAIVVWVVMFFVFSRRSASVNPS